MLIPTSAFHVYRAAEPWIDMTESTLIIDQGFILANSFVDILFTLVAVTVVMKVCKYLTPEPAWWMFV